MVVWRGWGVVSLLIAVGAYALGAELGGPAAASLHIGTAYLSAAALLVGAIANWFLGTALNRPLAQAGIGAFKHHSLFFIPMQWWSIVMVLGAAVLVQQAMMH